MRGTYIIDKAGVVRWKVENAIPDARDLDEYRKALAEIS
jgi:alkyl hydroperoxide reductase subunit AhpC